MDAYIKSLDTLKDGITNGKLSKGKTFKVEAASPSFSHSADRLLIEGESFEGYYNQNTFSPTTPDREIVRKASIWLSSGEIISLVQYAKDHGLIPTTKV
jgi:hypothetical protein